MMTFVARRRACPRHRVETHRHRIAGNALDCAMDRDTAELRRPASRATLDYSRLPDLSSHSRTSSIRRLSRRCRSLSFDTTGCRSP